ARLDRGVTVEQARAEVAAIAEQLEQQYPASNAGVGGSVSALRELVVGQTRPALLTLLGAIGCVLLIACINIANLLLVRSTAQRRDVAVRAALGAGRARLAGQALIESLVLGLLGGALGLILAPWGVELLKSIPSSGVPRLSEATIDVRVLGFSVAVSILTSIVFGLAPALVAAGTRGSESLRQGRRVQPGSASVKFRAVMVVGELALALVLLAAAGLLIRSFSILAAVNPGFDSKNLLTGSIRLPSSRYANDEQICAFTDQLLQRVQQ